MSSFEHRVALGRALAPLEPWGEFGKRMVGESPATTGGMVALVMQESKPEGRDQGWRRIQIEPSVKPDPQRGVSVKVNDHYVVNDPRDELGATVMMSLLREHFEPSIQESRQIISSLMDFAGSLK